MIADVMTLRYLIVELSIVMLCSRISGLADLRELKVKTNSAARECRIVAGGKLRVANQSTHPEATVDIDLAKFQSARLQVAVEPE
jgi:hypothetical protein